jgi:hypothetical protein
LFVRLSFLVEHIGSESSLPLGHAALSDPPWRAMAKQDHGWSPRRHMDGTAIAGGIEGSGTDIPQLLPYHQPFLNSVVFLPGWRVSAAMARIWESEHVQ